MLVCSDPLRNDSFFFLAFSLKGLKKQDGRQKAERKNSFLVSCQTFLLSSYYSFFFVLLHFAYILVNSRNGKCILYFHVTLVHLFFYFFFFFFCYLPLLGTVTHWILKFLHWPATAICLIYTAITQRPMPFLLQLLFYYNFLYLAISLFFSYLQWRQKYRPDLMSKIFSILGL